MSDPRPVLRTFGRIRSRPIKPRQAALMETLLPQIATPDEPFDPRALAPSAREVWLEIGFGGGEHLAEQAARRPDVLVLGAEPFLNGIASALRHVDERSLNNVRIHAGDARLLMSRLPDACLDRIVVLFPDPWPKARHHKRRFLAREGFALLARVLQAGATLRIATDDPDYLEWILEHAAAEGSFVLEMRSGVRPADWPATRYEEKALKAGRQPGYLVFICRSRKPGAAAGEVENRP